MTDLGPACVIVASTRAANGVYPDKSGPILTESLAGLGFQVSEVVVVPDGDAVGAALRTAVAEHDVVLTSGGTGITPTDVTPQQTAPLLDYEIPQIPAAIARFGVDKGIPTALLSRGLAGVAGGCLVVNLPGSSGGVRDAMEVLAPILPHAVSQLRGGDH